MLGVIGALEEEVNLLHAGMEISGTARHAEIAVTRGTLGGTDITLAQCGIGKVNATICTQMMLDLYHPDAFVFSGVAGGLLPNMRTGDLIIASHLIQYDMDLTAFGRRPGELPGKDRMIECDPTLVQKAPPSDLGERTSWAREPNDRGTAGLPRQCPPNRARG